MCVSACPELIRTPLASAFCSLHSVTSSAGNSRTPHTSPLTGLGSQVYSVFNDIAYDDIVTTVQSADVALVFVNVWSQETVDRANLYL